ncbi:Ubiquitin carboxyl terminal hydrolase BAP1, partial [Fasciola gigantica]
AHRRSGRVSANSSTPVVPNAGVLGPTSNCPAGTSSSDLARSQKDGVSARLRSSSGSMGNNHSLTDQGPDSDRNSLMVLSEVNELFFARQTVQNSCATHALLSVLLNRPELDLGPMLSEFQKATRQLSPEGKGTAIGSMPQLAQAHNRHAAQSHLVPNHQTTRSLTSSLLDSSGAATAAVAATTVLALSNSLVDSTSNISTLSGNTAASSVSSTTTTGTVNAIQLDTFHFVCYVPFGGFLYELDGLKPDPINHGPLQDPSNPSDWTRQCADILRQRMQEQDVRYSLMAVVPDRRLALTKRMCTLDKNRQIIEDTLLRIAQYEDIQRRRRSVDFRSPVNGTLGESSSPFTSAVVSRPDFYPSQSTVILNTMNKDSASCYVTSESRDGEQEINAIDNTLPQPICEDLVSMAKHVNRSICTRSSARSTNAKGLVSSVDGDTQGNDVLTQQSQNFPSSLTPQHSNSPTSDSCDATRKRSPTSSGLDEDEVPWVSQRKRRFLEEPSFNRGSCSDAVGSIDEEGGNYALPYSQMNKMLASIVSVESPLLTTLTEVVAAAAQDVSNTLDDSGHAVYQTAKQSNSPTAGGSILGSDTGQTIPFSRSVSNVGSNSVVKFEDNGQLTIKASETPSGTPTNEADHLSFDSHFISPESELPSELTKPLTVDTQLWDRARLASIDRLKPPVPNGVAPLGLTGLKQTEDANIEREFRPQTRALTRARVKIHSSTEAEIFIKSADYPACDSAEQPSSSNSPTPMDSPTTTRSPLSPRSDHPLLKREPTTGFHMTHTSDGCCTPSGELTVSYGLSLSGTDTKILGSSDSMRRASKYPTRSSTKRDTLASHNLANCRTNTTTVTVTACNTGHLPPNFSSSQFGHHGAVFRSHLLISATAKVSQTEPNSELSARSRSNEPVPRFTADELRLLLSRVKEQTKLCDTALLEEEEKRQTYRVDDARRVHNYEPFIRAYLIALSKHGLLKTLIVQALQNVPSLGSSLSFMSPTGNASLGRKSSGSADPLHHSRKSDSDRSLTGSKGSSPPTEVTVDSGSWTSSIRLSATETHSTPMPADCRPARRGLRARNKCGTSVSMHNGVPHSRKNLFPGNGNDRTVHNQPVPSVSLIGVENNHAVMSANDFQAPSTISDGLLNSLDSEAPGNTSVIGAETPDSLGSQSVKSKSQTVSPVPSNTTRNETADVSESGSVLQAPLSPLVSSAAQTSYSSCGSAPQSPQSSTSSRSTYLRPLRQNPRNDPAVIEDGFISRKSLRPRSSTDRRASSGGCQFGLSDSGDEQKSENGHKLFLRRRTYSSLVKHVDSSGACKPGPTTNPFSTVFSQRFRKRRLC